MQRKIVAGNIYHVLNRGVDKRKIFLDTKDHFRFIHDLFEFNDTEPVNNLTYYFQNTKSKDIARPYIKKRKQGKKRKLLVDMLAFCLMPNHYHLLMQPHTEDGISKFMKKLNMGYAKYFNSKYQRSGALFEGRYKAIRIEQEPHFIHLPYYIHLNPLDLKFPEWRNKEIKSYNKAITFLEQYRWSSFPDYVGIKNFPSVTQRDFLKNFIGEEKAHKSAMIRWLKELDQNISKVEKTTLE